MHIEHFAGDDPSGTSLFGSITDAYTKLLELRKGDAKWVFPETHPTGSVPHECFTSKEILATFTRLNNEHGSRLKMLEPYKLKHLEDFLSEQGTGACMGESNFCVFPAGFKVDLEDKALQWLFQPIGEPSLQASTDVFLFIGHTCMAV